MLKKRSDERVGMTQEETKISFIYNQKCFSHSGKLRYWLFCRSPLLSYYEAKNSKIQKGSKWCWKILIPAKAKVQNYEIEQNWMKLSLNII